MQSAKLKTLFLIALMFSVLLILTACGGDSPGAALKDKIGGRGPSVAEASDLPDLDTTPKVLVNEASGTAVFSGGGGVVDYSHADDGYVMISYDGSNPQVKVQISFNGGDPYNYDLAPNSGYQAFPLSQGSGSYDVGVFTNVSGDTYAQAAKQTIQASIADEMSPFLRPNQYVNFTAQSAAIIEAAAVAKGAKVDLGIVEKIFIYVTNNVTYDYDKAATVQSGYLPNIDETLATGKGICFDYASLTAAMLRSQGIPCKLVIGYAGNVYHAWIMVYSTQSGKVDSIVVFTDNQWSIMDPTFVAGGDTADPNLIGDGTHYNPLYYY